MLVIQVDKCVCSIYPKQAHFELVYDRHETSKQKLTLQLCGNHGDDRHRAQVPDHVYPTFQVILHGLRIDLPQKCNQDQKAEKENVTYQLATRCHITYQLQFYHSSLRIGATLHKLPFSPLEKHCHQHTTYIYLSQNHLLSSFLLFAVKVILIYNSANLS